MPEEFVNGRLLDESLASALTGSPATVWVQDEHLQYVWVLNPFMGLTVDEVVGKTDSDLLDAAFAERISTLKRRAMENREDVRETVKLVNADSSETHDMSISPILDEEDGAPLGVSCVSMRLPDDQMTLADEANHRIKNSLLLAQSLLRMQRRNSESADVKNALLEAEGQVHSISQFHGKLAEGGISGKVSLREYLDAICSGLVETFADNHQLQIETDVAEIELDGQRALKLALMISELIMNSVKHAPQERAPLLVRVIFQHEAPGYRLVVEDNGEGLPADFDKSADSGVGMRILQTLSGDLGTAMQISRKGQGAKFVFNIPAS